MNLLSFPFYPALAQQSRFLGCGQVPRALPAPQSHWLPFVLRLPVSGQGLDCVRIYRAQTNALYKTVSSSAFSYDAYSDGQQDYIFYYGGIVSNLNLPCDEYYLEVKGYFSEVFTVVGSLENYLRLEWKSETGIYQTGFSNLLYLDAVVAEPTYKIEEEGEEDAEGNFVAFSTKVEKTLKLDTLLLPEFLVDALAGIALHTTKQIGRYLEAKGLKVTPTWNKKGCAATVELTFLDGAAAVAEGCGTEAPFMAIDLSGFVPTACDGTAPNWISSSNTRCQQQAGQNTGWLEVQQTDTNPISGTYNQTRWVRLRQDETACPLPLPLLRSKKIEALVYRTNCNPDQEAGFVTFTVPEGQFTGTDQAVIDQQALAYFDANKEAYANANATCIPARRVQIESYTKGTKFIGVVLKRSDAAGPCTVTINTDILGSNGGPEESYSATFVKVIPDGQNSLVTSLAQGGYVVSSIQSVEIVSVLPPEYSF